MKKKYTFSNKQKLINPEWHQQNSRIGVFSPHLISHQKHQLWLPPTDKSTFVGAQESSREVAAPHWRKNSKNKHIEEGKKNSITLLASPLLQVIYSSVAKEDSSVDHCSHRGKWEHSEHPFSPVMREDAQEVHFFLAQPGTLRGSEWLNSLGQLG